jgi:hypothetical protein
MARSPKNVGYETRSNQENTLLWTLADHTDLIQRGANGTVRVLDIIDTPYGDHDIIDRKKLFSRILGSVASEYHWEGSYEGPHHLMWPRRFYYSPVVRKRESDEAARYRGSPSLKVILPRQLHDYLHRITLPPVPPSLEVMRQYNLEQEQVNRLYNTVSLKSYSLATDLTFEEKEMLRRESLLRKLEVMEDGQVGLMPDIATLAELPVAEIRQRLRHLARPLGISAHRAARRVFFGD